MTLIVLGVTLVSLVMVNVAIMLVWGWAARDSDYSSQVVSPEEAAKAGVELQTRSTLEDAEAKGELLVAQIEQVMIESAPTLRFEDPKHPDESIKSCFGPFSATNGKLVRDRYYHGTLPVADDQWSTIRDQSIVAAKGLGIELAEIKTSDPTTHLIVLATESERIKITINNTDSRGANTSEKSFIVLNIACHLPAEKFNSPVEPTR
ncbi:LppA family lipoprotein [Nocardia sp. NPDC058666]|uniref:LppA family lipoprotein n=1 Tax=unclassified Nocardia TaxID=2637762 RepID=UPI00364BA122